MSWAPLWPPFAPSNMSDVYLTGLGIMQEIERAGYPDESTETQILDLPPHSLRSDRAEGCPSSLLLSCEHQQTPPAFSQWLTEVSPLTTHPPPQSQPRPDKDLNRKHHFEVEVKCFGSESTKLWGEILFTLMIWGPSHIYIVLVDRSFLTIILLFSLLCLACRAPLL